MFSLLVKLSQKNKLNCDKSKLMATCCMQIRDFRVNVAEIVGADGLLSSLLESACAAKMV